MPLPRKRTLRAQVEREKRGWSLQGMAQASGLNPTTVSLIEKGRFDPYDSQLEKLAAALDWAGDPELLLDEVGGHADDEA